MACNICPRTWLCLSYVTHGAAIVCSNVAASSQAFLCTIFLSKFYFQQFFLRQSVIFNIEGAISVVLSFLICRQAMRTFGIQHVPAIQPSAVAHKKRRCDLCPRGEDKKVARVCSTCSKPICPAHSQLQIICDECQNA